MVVLSKQLALLVDMSGRITGSLRELRQLVSEQELVDQLMKAPIVSVKHIITLTPNTATVGTLNNLVIATAVVSPDANNSGEVVEGSVIKAVYLEFWATGDDAAQGSCAAFFEKSPSGLTLMTNAQSLAPFSYPNKKNIFHSFQGLMPSNTQNPMNIIKGWIKIPKGKQRMGLGDRLVYSHSGITDGTTICGIVIYKEYR